MEWQHNGSKFVTEFDKSGWPLNMWQCLVTIIRATLEIGPQKKKEYLNDRVKHSGHLASIAAVFIGLHVALPLLSLEAKWAAHWVICYVVSASTSSDTADVSSDTTLPAVTINDAVTDSDNTATASATPEPAFEPCNSPLTVDDEASGKLRDFWFSYKVLTPKIIENDKIWYCVLSVRPQLTN